MIYKYLHKIQQYEISLKFDQFFKNYLTFMLFFHHYDTFNAIKKQIRISKIRTALSKSIFLQSKQHYSIFFTPLKSSLNSVGVVFLIDLKTLLKFAILLNPASKAVSETVRFFSINHRAA